MVTLAPWQAFWLVLTDNVAKSVLPLWLPAIGLLTRRALLTRRLAFDFTLADRTFDACIQPTVVGRQVGIPGHGRQQEALRICEVDEILQLAGLPI
jgi:hypothetical protein